VIKQAGTPASLLTYAEQRALEIGCTIASCAQIILLHEPHGSQ
jgi:branched-chain amino acid transport system ATP-binding protein